MKTQMKKMAKEVGAKDKIVDGNAGVYFTNDQFHEFVNRLLHEVNNVLDSDIAQADIQKHFGNSFN